METKDHFFFNYVIIPFDFCHYITLLLTDETSVKCLVGVAARPVLQPDC